MNKTIKTLFIFMLPMIIASQTSKIHKTDGSVSSEGISEIDSITFSTANGGEQGIPCPGIPTVDYEGQTYNTVLIGEQCWLKENLNVGTMIESNTGGFLQSDNGIIEKYCYDNNPSNCDEYGGLYEWPEAMQYVETEGAQGICPDGWHIPTYTEMRVLENYANDEPAKLVDESQANSWVYTATNETGFSVLFAGRRDPFYGDLLKLGENTYFWSSSLYYFSYAIYLHLSRFSRYVAFIESDMSEGFSVRCLKD